MSKLLQGGYVHKRTMQVVHPRDSIVSPVFHLTESGLEVLAGQQGDNALLRKPLQPSQPQHLHHYIAVSETHRLFEASVTKYESVSIPRWVNEDELLFPEDPDSNVRLRSEFIHTKKVVCLPDAAFLIDSDGARVVVYLEQDRDTFFYDRVAARKSPGYREMLTTRWHKRQFPDTTLDAFFILFVTPNAKRSEQLRASFAKANGDHEVQRLYRFASLDELDSSNSLFEPVYTCCHHDKRVPLIRLTNTPDSG